MVDWRIEEAKETKSREYSKHKNYEKFRELQTKFDEIKEVNSKKYVEKEIEALKNSNIGQFYRRLKKLGSRLGECEESSSAFHLMLRRILTNWRLLNELHLISAQLAKSILR